MQLVQDHALPFNMDVLQLRLSVGVYGGVSGAAGMPSLAEGCAQITEVAIKFDNALDHYFPQTPHWTASSIASGFIAQPKNGVALK